MRHCFSLLCVCLFMLSSLHAGDAQTQFASDAPRLELAGIPQYRPLIPAKRGKEYRMNWPGDYSERNAIVLGWRLELPKGGGLAVGGLSIRTEDPRPPTLTKRGDQWVPISAELRAKNPLQSFNGQLLELIPTLKQITATLRHQYMEGRDEAAEKAVIEKDVTPRVATLSASLKNIKAALSKAGGSDKYYTTQAALAQSGLDQVLAVLSTLNKRTDAAQLSTLLQARQRLEQAADLLDAEPSARALSMPAYDAKTESVVLFGGDHFDYLSNDVWVFDLKAQRWMQQHPKSSPEPRANHWLESAGPGQLKMRGGFIFYRKAPGFESYANVHAGPDEWIYDIASETWQSPSGVQAQGEERAYRANNGGPDTYLGSSRPDAAAHEKMLSTLPTNTWVDLKPPHVPWGRDWGTMAYDPDRDMIYWYSGGHCVYSGADVLHYHLGSNRWDQQVETEHASGFHGGGESMPGWSFNRRAWICGHSWNSYGYHPGLKKMIVNGRQGLNNKYFDQNTYVYDPDFGDWLQRKATPRHFDVYNTGVRFIPGFGMCTWYGEELWKLDDKTLNWENVKLPKKLPPSRCDFSGLVFDPLRKRELFFSGGSYGGQPYSGEVAALSVPSLEISTFKPEGSELIKDLYKGKENILSIWVLREVAYHPGLDLFLFSSKLPGGYMVGLDMKKNRWVGVKLGGKPPFGMSNGVAYDSKRDLFYNLGAYGEAFALRLDPKTLEIKPFNELVALAASESK